MRPRTSRRAETEEQGFALVVVMLLILIVAGLSAVVVSRTSSRGTQTARSGSWTKSLGAAEAGVSEAIAHVLGGNLPTGVETGTTGDGTYSYRVLALARSRYQIDAVGEVGGIETQRAVRRVRVSYAPPEAFSEAIFSLSDVTLKNNDYVDGGVWANQYVTVDKNNEITGSVTAVGGYLRMENNSRIGGDVHVVGYNSIDSNRSVAMSNGASIGGSVVATSATPNCGDDPGKTKYKVASNGGIGGSVTAWGAISGGSAGPQQTGVCSTPRAPRPIPPFEYNPANYPSGSVQEFASPSAFNTFLGTHGSSLSGVFYVNGGSTTSYINLAGVRISGDTIIFAPNAPIHGDGMDGTIGTDKILVLASWYTAPAADCTTTGGNPGDCAIGFKNDFTAAQNTAVLLYAPNGPVAFKNNADFNGAVYANNVQVKNNMSFAFDPRISRIAGFGGQPLAQQQWLECKPAAISTTSC